MNDHTPRIVPPATVARIKATLTPSQEALLRKINDSYSGCGIRLNALTAEERADLAVLQSMHQKLGKMLVHVHLYNPKYPDHETVYNTTDGQGFLCPTVRELLEHMFPRSGAKFIEDKQKHLDEGVVDVFLTTFNDQGMVLQFKHCYSTEFKIYVGVDRDRKLATWSGT